MFPLILKILRLCSRSSVSASARTAVCDDFVFVGLAQRWEKFQKSWRASAVLGDLKRKLKNFELENFKDEARNVYIATHAAFAKGDLHSLRDLVTENVYLVCEEGLKRV